MFRKKYNDLNKQINPEVSLITKTIIMTQSYEKIPSKKRHSFRKIIMILISICFCFFLTIPVLAGHVSPIYGLMYRISPSIAQFFIPVQKSDEDQGIKMEVVSVSILENAVQIYITLQDLTGNRIDNSIDLYDSYTINRPFASSARCEFVGYEEGTKTATFLITIDEWGEKEIIGDKITFSVKKFLSHKNFYKDVLIPIDLSTISVAENVSIVSANGGGGNDYRNAINSESDPIALIPSNPRGEFFVEGIELTGLGYINEKLHIQIAVKDALDNDNHGYFYLKDEKGYRIDSNYSFGFFNDDKQVEQRSYNEYVFAVPEEELFKYRLYGEFVTSGMKTEGDWSVTFPLE